MKKFFSKLPVMITLLILTLVLGGVYAYLLARPVAIGFTYNSAATLKIKEGTTFLEFEGEVKVQFKNDKVVYIGIDGIENNSHLQKIDMPYNNDFYYYKKGNKIILGPSTTSMTLEQYEQENRRMQSNKTIWEESSNNIWIGINAFSMNNLKYTKNPLAEFSMGNLTCAGTIVSSVLLGIVELALIAFSAYSVVVFVKSNKNK